MAKYVIDIPEELFECAKEHRLISYAPVLEAVANATPLGEVLEDIKAEIYNERTNISFNLSEEKAKWVNSGVYDGLVWAEEIIDKHISGKE